MTGQPAGVTPGLLAAPRHGSVMDDERVLWHEIIALIGRLTPEEAATPGYYRDPDWSVQDLVAHLGTWLAESQVQLERLASSTYDGHDIDVDALNGEFLAAMHGQPWEVTLDQAHAARTMMLQQWYDSPVPGDEARWWATKGGAHHYAEHLTQLEAWVAELLSRRRRGVSSGNS